LKVKTIGLLIGWAAILVRPGGGVCQEIDWRGQISGWLTVRDNKGTEAQLGLRAIPTFSLKKSFKNKTALDAEISFNAYGTVPITTQDEISANGEIKPYRLWVRFSTARLEVRLGLQKINFGSALLLRPLMWFDRIDPNDPLQLTDGVYGLLAKYTFLNNANVWVWGLYGNKDPKGWETIPTQSKTAEYGGRFEFPFLKGETAISFHHRRMDPARSLLPLPAGETSGIPETRIGLDGKWDIGVGVWLEGVLIYQDFQIYPRKYQKMINLGLDYTFSVGNGLHLAVEHLTVEASENIFRSGESVNFSVLSLDYPLGLLDRTRGIIFHNWKTGDWYRFLTWQRTYDKWSFFVIGFWNPDQYQIYASQQGKNLFAGKGIQIMAVFNY